MKVRCEFCRKKMSASGIPAHVSFKHRGFTWAKFRMNPIVIAHCLLENGFIPQMQLALPAPNPLTVYSRRPLGVMASPIPELRRPKGYNAWHDYVIPALRLMGHGRYGRPIY